MAEGEQEMLYSSEQTSVTTKVKPKILLFSKMGPL